MNNKGITVTAFVELIPDGASLMIGGFMGVGSPHRIIEELVRQNKKHLTVIANDSGFPNVGIGKLIDAKSVDHLIASHIGTNPVTQRQMIAGELVVELCPQGTLIERIRCGGFGLGGVLTPTGIGTLAAEGKQILTLDGGQFIYEKPLKADFSLLASSRTDYRGNISYSLTARNFNPMMAFAGKTVVVEPTEIVPVGVIAPDDVVTPHVLVDYIIERRQSNGR